MSAAPAPAEVSRPSRWLASPPHPGASPGVGDSGAGCLPPSNNTNNDTVSTGATGNEGGGRRAATVLLLTHVVEVVAMVAAILTRAFPSLVTDGPQHDPDIKLGIWNESGLPLQVTMATAPLVVITAISLVWAVRAQDFSGRATARMLCWLLHILQASILWRFLKVHLAFDSSDVAELATLRFVQVHVHTLPFLVVHVALILGAITAPGAVSILVAAVVVVSGVVAIVVATTASHSSRPSSLTPPTITQVAHDPADGQSERNHDAAARVVVAVTTACIIWSRVVAVAVLFCLHITWAAVLVAFHWLAAIVWLGVQKELEATALGPIRKVLRRIFLAYLLLWDWHVFRDDASAMTVCARPRLPAAYYSVTAIQNVVVTVTWYTTSKTEHTAVRTAALSSVLAAQVMALLLLVLSYLYCSSLLPSWPRNKASALARTASLVTPSAKSAALPVTTDNHDRDDSSYIDFKDVEDGIEPEVGKGISESDSRREAIVTPLKGLPPMAHSTPRSPLPLPPRLMAAHLPPTMFSFSHDILPPRLAKSERSSTDNGSFNSRNTNTLPGQLPPEYDVLQRAHGSFSDSFSSLSCGTIGRATANNRAVAFQDVRTQGTPPPGKLSHASHSSCRNGFCHCKLFDGIEGPCDVEEEDEEEEENQQPEIPSEKDSEDEEDESHVKQHSEYSTNANGGTKEKSVLQSPESVEAMCETAPRVAVVRGVQRFRVVCAACLHAHDPLLTRCHVHASAQEQQFISCQAASIMRSHMAGGTLSQSCGGGLGGGSSTDYPSDTEVTASADTLSSASADSHSTYTTWPVGRGPGMARLLQLHPGSHDYVTAWLRHQQARGPRAPPPPPQVIHQSSSPCVPDSTLRHQRRLRRHLSRPLHHKDPPPPHLMQDLETVV